jgi:hypothetical protein
MQNQPTPNTNQTGKKKKGGEEASERSERACMDALWQCGSLSHMAPNREWEERVVPS